MKRTPWPAPPRGRRGSRRGARERGRGPGPTPGPSGAPSAPRRRAPPQHPPAPRLDPRQRKSPHSPAPAPPSQSIQESPQPAPPAPAEPPAPPVPAPRKIIGRPAAGSRERAMGLVEGARVAAARGDLEAAVGLYERALRTGWKIPEALCELADIHAQRGKPRQARALLVKAATLCPTDGAVWLARGQFELRHLPPVAPLGGDPKMPVPPPPEGTPEMIMGVNVHEGLAATYREASMAAKRAVAISASMEALRVAMVLSPEVAFEARLETAHGTLTALQNPLLARSHYEAAVALNPESAMAHLGLGVTLSLMLEEDERNEKRARDEFIRAANLANPPWPELFGHWARFEWKTGRVEVAKKLVQHGLEIQPDYFDTLQTWRVDTRPDIMPMIAVLLYAAGTQCTPRFKKRKGSKSKTRIKGTSLTLVQRAAVVAMWVGLIPELGLQILSPEQVEAEAKLEKKRAAFRRKAERLGMEVDSDDDFKLKRVKKMGKRLRRIARKKEDERKSKIAREKYIAAVNFMV
mmetsp:Transcript_11579/g.29282  ORF Transcript_11579/g.29282 Transcript_11579/m.29282 type:complete len:522 (-) Transcript_11579:131-1696(-)